MQVPQIRTPLRALVLFSIFTLAGCPTTPVTTVGPTVQPGARPKIGLALGGGAARGFAHIGVIKALEAQGIVPDIVVGTSAGSVVGALYAGGASGYDLQALALGLEDSAVSDWSLPDRGVIRGDALQNYVNKVLANRPIEALPRTLGIVATDLRTGEMIVFRRGNVGMAVRASASVPGVFQPLRIGHREYVDGGLVSPVPAKVARDLGAVIVIAVDISSKPQNAAVSNTVEVLLQTFTIMGAALAQTELVHADVVIRPDVGNISGTDFQSKHLTLLEGEKAASMKMAEIRAALARVGHPAATAAGAQTSIPR